MAWLFVLTMVVVAVVALAAFFSSSVVKPYVDRTVSKDINGAQAPVIAPTVAGQATVPPVTNGANGARQMVITQQEINDQIARNPGAFGPVDDVKVQIDSGAFIVNFKAYGLSGRYSGQVAIRDGEPVLTNGRVSGPLGLLVSSSTVEDILNQQIAAQVSHTGVQVSSVALRPGEMVLTFNA